MIFAGGTMSQLSVEGFHKAMNCKRLRDVYRARASQKIAEIMATTPEITVTLGQLLPLLQEAMQTQRLWVNDFLDEEITLSSDLYEVLQAFELNFGPAQEEVA
jgi:hypothetical protein